MGSRRDRRSDAEVLGHCSAMEVQVLVSQGGHLEIDSELEVDSQKAGGKPFLDPDMGRRRQWRS